MIPGHFPPDAIHVRRGIRITWFAGGPTTDSSLTATTGGASESPLIPVGRVFTTTMNTTGNFTYGCEPNSLMTRSGIVE